MFGLLLMPWSTGATLQLVVTCDAMPQILNLRWYYTPVVSRLPLLLLLLRCDPSALTGRGDQVTESSTPPDSPVAMAFPHSPTFLDGDSTEPNPPLLFSLANPPPLVLCFFLFFCGSFLPIHTLVVFCVCVFVF